MLAPVTVASAAVDAGKSLEDVDSSQSVWHRGNPAPGLARLSCADELALQSLRDAKILYFRSIVHVMSGANPTVSAASLARDLDVAKASRHGYCPTSALMHSAVERQEYARLVLRRMEQDGLLEAGEAKREGGSQCAPCDYISYYLVTPWHRRVPRASRAL